MPDTPLDDELVASILENLKVEPAAQLRAILDYPEDGPWSAEAREAARLLLEQRSKGLAPEPECRSVPMDPGTERRPSWAANLVLAPGFSLPRGFSWLLFLARVFGRSCLYAAVVEEVRGAAVYVRFHNGDRGWVRRTDIRPFELDVGHHLYCAWRGKTGVILRWRDADEKFYIAYDDGQGEWATLAMIAVPPSTLPPDLQGRTP